MSETTLATKGGRHLLGMVGPPMVERTMVLKERMALYPNLWGKWSVYCVCREMGPLTSVSYHYNAMSYADWHARSECPNRGAYATTPTPSEYPIPPAPGYQEVPTMEVGVVPDVEGLKQGYLKRVLGL